MKRFGLIAVAVGFMSLAGMAIPASAATNNAQTQRGLEMTLPQIKLDNVSLGDAIDFLRDVSGANLHVNWRALEEAGVSKDTQVNVRVRSVSLRKVLDLLMADAAGGTTLTYYVDQNVVEITTQELADQMLITRVYPVQDLVMEIPDFDNAPDFNLEALSNNNNNQNNNGSGSSYNSNSSGSSSGSDSLFNETSGNSREEDKGMSKTERADQLVKLIQDIIRPNIWKANGGPASIRFFNGNLIVTAPRSVQEAIGGPVP